MKEIWISSKVLNNVDGSVDVAAVQNLGKDSNFIKNGRELELKIIGKVLVDIEQNELLLT